MKDPRWVPNVAPTWAPKGARILDHVLNICFPFLMF